MTRSNPIGDLASFMSTNGFKTAVWPGWRSSDCPELTLYYGDAGTIGFNRTSFKIGSPEYMRIAGIEIALERGEYSEFSIPAKQHTGSDSEVAC